MVSFDFNTIPQYYRDGLHGAWEVVDVKFCLGLTKGTDGGQSTRGHSNHHPKIKQIFEGCA